MKQLYLFSIFLIVASVNAYSKDKKDSCWRDYASGQPEVNYERAFAKETVIPERIIIGDKIIRAGKTEMEINDILGQKPFSTMEWVERDVEEQCEYLVELFRPTIFPYQFMEVRNRRLKGSFMTADWNIGEHGTLRAFFRKSSKEVENGTVWLLQVILNTVPQGNIIRVKGEDYMLRRNGKPAIQWDVSQNQIFINSYLNNNEKATSFDLKSIKHISPKGRVQDKSYNPDLGIIDQIIANGIESIPTLIIELTNTEEIEAGVVDYWGMVEVGDMAFIILVDLFTDETWKNSTVAGYGFYELIDGKKGDIPSAAQFSNYVKSKGRSSLKKKWQKLWDTHKDSLYWDNKSKCFRVTK